MGTLGASQPSFLFFNPLSSSKSWLCMVVVISCSCIKFCRKCFDKSQTRMKFCACWQLKTKSWIAVTLPFVTRCILLYFTWKRRLFPQTWVFTWKFCGALCSVTTLWLAENGDVFLWLSEIYP
jgi:hypothetical protein